MSLREPTVQDAQAALRDRLDGAERRMQELLNMADHDQQAGRRLCNMNARLTFLDSIFEHVGDNVSVPIWAGLKRYDAEHLSHGERWLVDVLADTVLDRLLGMSETAELVVWSDDELADHLMPVVSGLRVQRNPLRIARVTVQRRRLGQQDLLGLIDTFDHIRRMETQP